MTTSSRKKRRYPAQNLEVAPSQLDLVELAHSLVDPIRFIQNYVKIESPDAEGWIPFNLWTGQKAALTHMHISQKVVILKARQLGLSWLALAYALWRMIAFPESTILLFSLREAEARELLRRLIAMFDHLPPPLNQFGTVEQSANRWRLTNGSRAIAFSTRGGRSYTGTLAIVDEADFVPHLADFLNGVKPTIDAGGKLMLISTADKSQPLSTFKRLFRAAESGESDYGAIFLPWYARVDRDHHWYARIAAEMRAQRGSDDDLHQEYPATIEQALRVRSLAARIPAAWISAIHVAQQPLDPTQVPSSLATAHHTLFVAPQVATFTLPEAGRAYLIGADPAEGNPHADESVAIVLDALTGEQVALLAGALEPESFASACAELSIGYHHAPILVERNNHGHSVIHALRQNGSHILNGPDGKAGFLTTAQSKAQLYDLLAQSIRQQSISLHDNETAAQLATIDALTLRAPNHMHDDRAMALALANHSLLHARPSAPTLPVAPVDPLARDARLPF